MKSLQKLTKVATKFQIKLAEIDDQAVLQAFNNFFATNAQTWFLSKNMSGAKEKHNAYHSLGETSYDWVVTVYVANESQKHQVEVGGGSMPGFEQFLTKQFSEAKKDQKSGLTEVTATFKVQVEIANPTK